MKQTIILIISLLISACSSSGGKAVDKIYYRFPIVTNAPIDKGLVIVKPTAMGILGNRPMVAQDTNGGLLQMNHSFWLDSPKLLLYNYLNKVFIQTSDVDNKLFSEIINLEKKGENSVLAIKFRIVDKNDTLVFNKTYKLEKPLAQNNIPTFVQNISSSLENIVQQLINDI